METLRFDTPWPVPPRVVAGIDRARRNIANSGAAWTGQQRVAIAQIARNAGAHARGDHADHNDALVPAHAQATAAKVATEAHRMTDEDVAGFDHPASYVEIVGVVARTVAIDTTARGIGVDPVPFPTGATDPPDGRVRGAAKKRSGLVPTVGAVGPVSGLSLLPSEEQAQAELHGSLYLSYAEMGDIRIVKGLPRWQLELVASRTSVVNSCNF